MSSNDFVCIPMAGFGDVAWMTCIMQLWARRSDRRGILIEKLLHYSKYITLYVVTRPSTTASDCQARRVEAHSVLTNHPSQFMKGRLKKSIKKQKKENTKKKRINLKNKKCNKKCKKESTAGGFRRLQRELISENWFLVNSLSPLGQTAIGCWWLEMWLLVFFFFFSGNHTRP